MSKFDILEQFTNEELKQVLRRRGESIHYGKIIDGITVKSNHAYSCNGADYSFYIHNVSNKTMTIKFDIVKDNDE